MKNKVTLALIATVTALALTSCGYQGGYRYACQDPANWNLEECKPPVCTVNGACPKDLVGEEVVNSGESIIDSQSETGGGK